MNNYYERYDCLAAENDTTNARELAHASAGRTWVGANPRFDERALVPWARPMVLAHHYALVDVTVLAAGHLLHLEFGQEGLGAPPWSLRKMLELAGVERDSRGAHTALGDAWDTVRLYAWVFGLDVVTEGEVGS